MDEALEQEEATQQAIDEALAELEEEEEQYQRLRNEELLFRITEEAEALLTAHREAMAQTREIDVDRSPGDRPSRAQRLRLRRLADDEGLLAGRAGELADAIEAENSVVFAEVLREVQQDLERIARDMGETGNYQTGSRIQTRQEDVEEAVLWILEALQKERERQEQEQAQQQQQQQQDESDSGNKERLVPDTAELKLLRRLEVDISESLVHLRTLYPELDDPDFEPDPYVLEDILRLAERHERTTRLFTLFRERLNIPDPEAPQIDLTEGDAEGEAAGSEERNQPR